MCRAPKKNANKRLDFAGSELCAKAPEKVIAASKINKEFYRRWLQEYKKRVDDIDDANREKRPASWINALKNRLRVLDWF